MSRQTGLHKETIIPKGIIEIIFNFSPTPPIQVQIDNSLFYIDKCFINGFNTKPVHIFSPEKQQFFGIRFHPTAIKQLFRIPAGEFANQVTDLTLIDKEIDSLWHQLAETEIFEERIKILSNWINVRTGTIPDRDLLFNQFLNSTLTDIPSVTTLANSLYYSTRQLSRKLVELTGINTEQVLAYKKFQLAVQLIHHTDRTLTQIAYDSQFADQSHFIKNFKSFAAITPMEYRQNKSMMPGHIYKNI